MLAGSWVIEMANLKVSTLTMSLFTFWLTLKVRWKKIDIIAHSDWGGKRERERKRWKWNDWRGNHESELKHKTSLTTIATKQIWLKKSDHHHEAD